MHTNHLQRFRVRSRAVATATMAIIAGIASVSVPAAADQEAETAAAPTIAVDLNSTDGTVSPGVFGANLKYDLGGQGIWDSGNGEVHDDFFAKYKNSGVSNTRFPGGTIANTYRWQHAIGPVSERIPNPSGGHDGHPISNEFGPDEWAQFAEQAGNASGSIVVNFATGSAREAANFVEYMNAPVGTNPRGGTAWADVRAANGHPEPYNISWWEVGNEYGWGHQGYWMEQLPEEQRAAAYAFGAKVDFTEQPVVLTTDRGPDAALSDGSAGQQTFSGYTPVVPGSQTLYVGGVAWTEVDDLTGAGKANVYEFDPSTGAIQFGDGTDGAIPADGKQITLSYTANRNGFVDYYRVMKEADPNINVCTGFNAYSQNNTYPIDDLVEELGTDHPYDCIVDHKYGNVTTKDPDKYHDRMMLRPAQRVARVTELRELARQTSGRDVDVIVTEWSIFKATDTAPNYQLALGGGLFYGTYLNELIRAGVPLAHKHALSGWVFNDDPDGGRNYNAMFAAPKFVELSAVKVFNLYGPMADSTLVASTIKDNPTRALDDKGTTLAALDMVATKADDGTVRLTVVNRDRETNASTTVTVDGATGGAREATIRTLNGADIFTHNTENDQDRLTIVTDTEQVNPNGFTYTFPAHSITVIEFPASG